MNAPLHITFGSFAASVLKESFEINAELKGDVLPLIEDLSIGPLRKIQDETGQEKRTAWLSKIGANTSSLPYLLESDRDKYELIRSNLGLRDIYIWCGSDSKSHIGFLRLMYAITEFSDRIFILQFPTMIQYPIGEFPFRTIALLRPEQIGSLNHFFKLLNSKQFSDFPNEWLEMSNNNSVLRIENDKIVHVADDFFDEMLLSKCTNDFKKSARVVGEVLVDVFDRWQTAHDAYLNWRLKELVKMGKLDYDGILKEMLDYHVKIKK